MELNPSSCLQQKGSSLLELKQLIFCICSPRLILQGSTERFQWLARILIKLCWFGVFLEKLFHLPEIREIWELLSEEEIIRKLKSPQAPSYSSTTHLRWNELMLDSVLGLNSIDLNNSLRAAASWELRSWSEDFDGIKALMPKCLRLDAACPVPIWDRGTKHSSSCAQRGPNS